MKQRIPSKYSETVKRKIEEINEFSIDVRFEKGTFKTSDCIVDGKRILIINKSQTNDMVTKFLDSYIKQFDTVEA